MAYQGSPGLLNVLDYGAKGDGSTNDSPAVQAILDAADDGSNILFPNTGSSYVFNTTLNAYGSDPTNPKALNFVGGALADTSATLKAGPSFAGGPLINVISTNFSTQKTGFSFRNLYLDLGTSLTGVFTTNDGIYFDNVQQYVVENVKIRGGRTGVKIGYASSGYYSNLITFNQTDAGVQAIDTIPSITGTLAVDIASSGAVGTITLTGSTAGFASQGRVRIDDEVFSYTGTSGSTFTGCVRSVDASVAAAHTGSVTVIQGVRPGLVHKFLNGLVYLTSGANNDMAVAGMDFRGTLDIHLIGCHVLRSAGNTHNLPYGLKVTAPGPSFGGLLVTNSEFDGICDHNTPTGAGAAIHIQNYAKVFITNTWMSGADSATIPNSLQAALSLQDTNHVMVENSWLSGYCAIKFRGTNDRVTIHGNVSPTGSSFYDVGSSSGGGAASLPLIVGASGVSSAATVTHFIEWGNRLDVGTKVNDDGTILTNSFDTFDIGDGVTGRLKLGGSSLEKIKGFPWTVTSSTAKYSLNGSGNVFAIDATGSPTLLTDLRKSGVSKFTVDPSGNAVLKGNLVLPTRTVTANYTVKVSDVTTLTSDAYILADATSGAFAVTLPTAVGIAGYGFTIKRINTNANAVSIATTASQTIDGQASYSLSTPYYTITLVSDGSNWVAVNKTYPDSYTTVYSVIGAASSAVTAVPWYFLGDNTLTPNQDANAPAQVFYLDSAEYAVSGLTTKLRLRAQVGTNSVAPATSFTFNLHTLSAVGGGASKLSYLPGTIVSGSPITFSSGTLTANTMATANSGDFALPANGTYLVAVTVGGAPAANSRQGLTAQLQVRNV